METIELPEGVLYVKVLSADKDTPRLYVSSSPGEGLNEEREYLTLRGRRYYVEHHYRYGPVLSPDGYRQGWILAHTPYNGGYRRENNGSVDFLSSVGQQLNALEMRALDEFVKRVPDWKTQSAILALMQERSSKHYEIERAQREIEEWENAIVVLDNEIQVLQRQLRQPAN